MGCLGSHHQMELQVVTTPPSIPLIVLHHESIDLAGGFLHVYPNWNVRSYLGVEWSCQVYERPLLLPNNHPIDTFNTEYSVKTTPSKEDRDSKTQRSLITVDSDNSPDISQNITE